MTSEEYTHAVTEDEAALYDRQIRLWGLEAQNRIRKAHILVINLDGLTTEAIKNWVLAGISTLTVVDSREKTEWHDLSAGFFWRDEDVGQERLPPAAGRIQALNPLVKINVLPPSDLIELMDPTSSKLRSLGVDVAVVGIPSGPQGLSQAWGKASQIAFNERCRSLSISFYCAGTMGLNGWIFSDLGESHDYVIERPDVNAPAPASTSQDGSKEQNGNGATSPLAPTPATSAKKLEKRQQKFVPLRTALDTSWEGLSRAQQRRNRPSIGLFATWSLWDHIERQEEGEKGQVVAPKAADLHESALETMKARGVDPKMLVDFTPTDATAYFAAVETSIGQPGEFSPTCAILGGVLSQDVLNALGGREEPLVNWFQLEGMTGSGPIHALGTPASTVVAA